MVPGRHLQACVRLDAKVFIGVGKRGCHRQLQSLHEPFLTHGRISEETLEVRVHGPEIQERPYDVEDDHTPLESSFSRHRDLVRAKSGK